MRNPLWYFPHTWFSKVFNQESVELADLKKAAFNIGFFELF
jgi:hypothetical protein